MTTPVRHGFPDWGRHSAATDINVFNNQAVVGAATVIHGRFLVGTAPFVHLLYGVSAGGARLTLTWYGSQAGADLIATNTVDVRSIAQADGSFPCLGPYLELSSIADAAGRVVNLQVWQTEKAGSGFPLGYPDSLIAVPIAVLGAGATRTDNAQAVMWGWGHWFAATEAATTFVHTLQAVNYLNVVNFIAHKGLGVPMGETLFHLPPQMIRVVTTNFDAVAHNVFISVNHLVTPW